MGIVAEDCEKAAAFWERVFGIGPFSIDVYELNEKTQFRFKGEPGEQCTMFFEDPTGKALEFKAFADIEGQLFAK